MREIEKDASKITMRLMATRYDNKTFEQINTFRDKSPDFTF